MNEPVWLPEQLVLSIHADQIARFGGSEGLRDAGLMASALDRPRNRWAYEKPSLAELAAAYAYGLARNHPFVDGNKRIAFATADVFLQLNGYEIICEEPEAVTIFLALAAGELEEVELADWIAANLEAV
jgi:death-on-curing protein